MIDEMLIDPRLVLVRQAGGIDDNDPRLRKFDPQFRPAPLLRPRQLARCLADLLQLL